ncbi:MAG: EamA family transporter RarD [Nakamurella sp.]
MRRGIVYGLVAYSIWGLFPLFWPFLEPATAPEILAHRVVWSLLFMAIVLTVARHWYALRGLPRRTWLQVSAAAVLIAVNWGVYIFAVNHGKVVEAALGYYINPLVSVALAVVVLRERLRLMQWVAVSIAGVAALVIAVGTGGLPWIALTLAVSFALYGLVKKVVPLAATESLTAEALVLAPAALAFLAWLQLAGRSSLTGNGTGHVLLLAAGGLVTIVPLVAFAVAAQTLPLSVVGFLQYVTPTMQFLLGVFWAHEHMAPSRWVGFAIIWAALAVYSVDAVRHSRSSRPSVGVA